MRITLLSSIFGLAAAFVCSAAPSGYCQPHPPAALTECRSNDLLATIVCRIQAAADQNRANSFAYVLTRDYKIYKEDDAAAKSEVVANIAFVPPDHKSFTIESVQGSSRGASVIKHVLETETEQASKNATAAISPRNYDFKLIGDGYLNGRAVWVLQLIPRREDKALIRGKAWVDKDTFLIHRVSGELAKSPSFWLKKVTTTVDFGNANGLWIQTNSQAVADVRLLGKHVFDARAIEVRTGSDVAKTFSSEPPRSTSAPSALAGLHTGKPLARERHASPSVFGTAIWIRH